MESISGSIIDLWSDLHQQLQTSPLPAEASGEPSVRRGHISISDPSHHVTEAIGYMYGDDEDERDNRRLSYLCTPLSESISVSSIPRPSSTIGVSEEMQQQQSSNGLSPLSPSSSSLMPSSRPPVSRSRSYERDLSPGETATTSFPLNNVDYESDPAAVAQELNNLAAIRRMSMDGVPAGDPDLPNFAASGEASPMSPLPPSPSSDENDASRLFWVPARLHPELAPTEFKDFLESRTEQIARSSTAGENSSLGHELSKGGDGKINRRRSMLSKVIDSDDGYVDGADRLEQKKSVSSGSGQHLNLQDLKMLVDNSKQLNDDALDMMGDGEDKPILPPAPPGISLKRSTRTQYRKGGSRKGERPPYSQRRHARLSEDEGDVASRPQTPIIRVSTENDSSSQASSSPWPPRAPGHSLADACSSPEDVAADPTEINRPMPLHHQSESEEVSTPTKVRSASNNIRTPGRTLHAKQQLGQFKMQPSPSASTASSSQPITPRTTSSSNQENTTKLSSRGREAHGESQSAFSELHNSRQVLPGNNTRTDSLSIIPILVEDKKPEGKKSKDKKEEGGGGRKSSWQSFFLGSDEKDKKKEKDGDTKKNKNKSSSSSAEKAGGGRETPTSPRIDVLHSPSTDIPRGRESLVLDRSETKVEDTTRRLSGESKKEKDSGILSFSSIISRGKKKYSGGGGGGEQNNHHRHHHHHHGHHNSGSHKKNSRNLSPDPPEYIPQPDVDYCWSRFSITDERAIYRMAHIKLANPRRALHSQVLLSNFMYSYLAKVQPIMMAAAAAQSRQEAQQNEYLQYQGYQEVRTARYLT